MRNALKLNALAQVAKGPLAWALLQLLMVMLMVAMGVWALMPGTNPETGEPTPSDGARNVGIYGILLGLALLPIALIFVFQACRVLPVLWVRRTDAGLVVGGIWAIWRGRGLTISAGDQVHLTQTPANGSPNMGARQRMYGWNLSSGDRSYLVVAPARIADDAEAILAGELKAATFPRV